MELGMDLGEGSTGGGSDGSFTAAMGIPTLDGLGVGGDGAHAVDEHVYVNDIPPRAALLCRLAESIYDSVPAAGPDLFPLRAIGGHSGQRVFRDL
jgi:acetylornithine deacetylase/succinyl-diaminopimelate desuccinylase-like protein